MEADVASILRVLFVLARFVLSCGISEKWRKALGPMTGVEVATFRSSASVSIQPTTGRAADHLISAALLRTIYGPAHALTGACLPRSHFVLLIKHLYKT